VSQVATPLEFTRIVELYFPREATVKVEGEGV
jgi:hypothetical protein